MKIWHNNRCSKSRSAIDFLNEKGKEFEVYAYLDSPPDAKSLEEVIKMLGIKAEELVRKNEPAFKENFKGKKLNESQWIDAMIAYPKLIERPIIIENGKAVIGRPTENILKLL